MHFFSFFDVLLSAPTTTGMTLMLLMFLFLLISIFSPAISQFFPYFCTNSYVSRYRNINYGTTSVILIHYNNIWFSCLDLSVTLDHNIPQNLHFFIFNNTFWNMFKPFFTSFSGCISHTISNELFLQHYCAFSCTPFVPTFCILLQYEILFQFSCHTFYKVMIGFHIVCLNCLLFRSTQHGFCFNFQVSFS